jgi:hypothetical protein
VPYDRHPDERPLNGLVSVGKVVGRIVMNDAVSYSKHLHLKGHPMSRATNTAIFAITIAMLGTTVTGAFAESRWERNHPRRDQVNDRLENQNRRINNELRQGEITKSQANQLHSEDHAIRQEERTMSKFDNGHITPADQKALNQQENAVSKQIGR